MDFDVTYENNINVTTPTNRARAIITGKGLYHGSFVMPFDIHQRSMAEMHLQINTPLGIIDRFVYDGQAKTPVPRVSVSGHFDQVLQEGRDYSLSYANNTQVGTATVTATGIGNYKDSKDLPFYIGHQLPPITRLSQDSYDYDGQPKTPTVYIDGLTEGTDYYTFSIENVQPGLAVAYAYALGNYAGFSTKHFNIVGAPLPAITAVTPNSFVFTGQEHQPAVTIPGLAEGTDYYVTYHDNVKAGQATAIVHGLGWHSFQTTTATFTITPAMLPAIYGLEAYDYTADGSEKKPSAQIHFAGVALVEGTDYTLSYENNIYPGRGTVIASGKGNFKGSSSPTFAIAYRSLHADNPEVTVARAVYHGGTQTPKVTITGLEEGKDFRVEYLNDDRSGPSVEAGQGWVSIVGLGIYHGDWFIKGFAVEPAPLPRMDPLSKDTYAFDGIAKEPAVTIPGMIQGTDYDVAYANNLNAGTATVTVTGKGNYAGTQTAEYTITRAALPGITSPIPPGFVFDGTEKKPVVSISGLAEGMDFDISYANNVEAGTAIITATGKGNYTGTATATFAIFDGVLPDISSVSPDSYTYDGTAKEPVIIITGLTEGTDFEVGYTDNIHAGTATVTATGIGGVTGNSSSTFVIHPAPLPTASPIGDQTYSGQAIQPRVTLAPGPDGAALIAGQDYQVAFRNNTSGGLPGQEDQPAVAVITGMGNYIGSLELPFVIRDEAAPFFDRAGAVNHGGRLDITVHDNFGLAKVRVFRDSSVVLAEDFTAQTPATSHRISIPFTRGGMYWVEAEDLAGHSTQLYPSGRIQGDQDQDGLSNAYEAMRELDEKNPDTDGDGLSDGEEVLTRRTNPLLADSDTTGINDGHRVRLLAALPHLKDLPSLPLALLLGDYHQAKDVSIELSGLTGLVPLKSAGPIPGEQVTLNPEELLILTRIGQNRLLASQEGQLVLLEVSPEGNAKPLPALSFNDMVDQEGTASFPQAPDTHPVAVSAAQGDLVLLGFVDEATGLLAADLLLMDDQMNLYLLPDTRGASRFELAPTGSHLAYLKDGSLHLMSLMDGNLQTLDQTPDLLGFAPAGQPILAVEEDGQVLVLAQDGTQTTTAYTGVLKAQQATNTHHSLLLVHEGKAIPFSLNAALGVSDANGSLRLLVLPGHAMDTSTPPAPNHPMLYGEGNQELGVLEVELDNWE